LTNEKHNILIDTGHKNKRSKLERALTNLKVKDIDYLVLTHSHFDHAGNAEFAKEKFNAKVVIHASEYEYLKTGNSPLPKGSIFLTKFIIHATNVFSICPLYEPCVGNIQLADTFNFSNMGINSYVLHTPGHSIGFLSIIIDNEIAIVGDAMFGVFPWSVFPPYADNVTQMVNSWKILLDSGCSTFLPAHGRACSYRLLKKEYAKNILKGNF
jgi:glyoxylase-like metal-dependent hydrolase (beta-lactamase superfamily II)